MNVAELAKNDSSIISQMAAIESSENIEEDLKHYKKLILLIKNDKNLLSTIRKWFIMTIGCKGYDVTQDKLKQIEETLLFEGDMLKQKAANIANKFREEGDFAVEGCFPILSNRSCHRFVLRDE